MGVPVVDEQGNCTCKPFDGSESPTGGVKAPPGLMWTPAGWVPIRGGYYYPPTVNPPRVVVATKLQDSDGKIFGFSPFVVLGAAAVGLYILSLMDGKK